MWQCELHDSQRHVNMLQVTTCQAGEIYVSLAVCSASVLQVDLPAASPSQARRRADEHVNFLQVFHLE